MNEEQLRQFLEKLVAGTYTNEEYADFTQWAENCSRIEYEQILIQWEAIIDNHELQEIPHHGLFEKIEAGLDEIDADEETPVIPIGTSRGNGRTLWPRIAVAVSIVLAISVGSYFIIHEKAPIQQAALLKPGTFKNDVLPGNKATMTLANGQKIIVTTLPTGQVANTNFKKTSNGAIVYENTPSTTEVVYNTFTVPRGGGKHQIQLADGTLAVLDAGSSIKFPVAFTGNERKVEVTGQVYFEVVHSDAQPFSVMVRGELIQDLGTHFNINAFEDEPVIKTTLLEGSIKVSGITLKRGQQAVGNVQGKISVLDNVDEEEVMAWKNDLFKFTSNTSLHAVMNQLSRWYDLDVVYQGNNKDFRFGGFVPRNSNLSDVLKILAYSGVRFSIDGKKIIVYQ